MENKTVALSRQLAMVAYIERFPGISVEELASRFARTDKQVRRDIDLLDRAGFGDLLPDKTFALDMDRYISRGELAIDSSLSVKSPLLTREESTYIIMGLQAIAPTLDASEAQSIPGLLSSLLAISDPKTLDISHKNSPSLVRVIDSNLPTGTWHLVRQAIQTNVRLSIRYLSSQQEISQREIDPLQLFRHDDGWIVKSWCHKVRAIRSFRLDRIISCELLTSFQEHPDLDISEREKASATCKVELRLGVGWLVNELPTQDVTIEGDRLLATFQVWDFDWMVARLLELGSEVISTDPPSYLQSARKKATSAKKVWESFQQHEDEIMGM